MCREFGLFLLSGFLLVSSASLVTAVTPDDDSPSFETVHTSNAAILNRLGLTPLQIPDGHHKKRLAGPEPPGLSSQMRIHQPYSRRHGHRDSHVYMVKLPASPPYYTITRPHKSVDDNDKITKTGPNFPVGFQGNGKPAKIYHWNLPVMKKMTEKKRLHLSQLRSDQAKKRLDDAKKRQQLSFAKTASNKIYSLDTAGKNYEYRAVDTNKIYSHQKSSMTKHVRNNDKRLSYPDDEKSRFESTKRNDAVNKAYRLDDLSVHRIHLTNELHGSRNTAPKMKKHRKKAAMSYYAPIATKTGSSTSVHNFPGNGKPKAFYIMEKSRKPVYYHPLLP
ncbi:uncharacterized protein LOC109864119 [Pseudomyrmex gracilis]|uniref:uncharacterized protein LOC109864119 n=1 Tax=Pseudomyrmex gracilis TaxID=219809 RepID=UPI0009949E24|nr:uncharacterized protein LOC109864119 [Pseudomyrmex gracilis]